VSEQYFAAMTEELTRRQWFLRLGKIATLAGFSGLVPEVATGLLSAEQEQADLPLGLYEPSGQHLIHALRSADQPYTTPPGSETDCALPGRFPFRPHFFSEEEFRIVTRLVEIIVGKVEPAALSQTTQWLDLWFHSAAGVREAAQNLDPMHRVLAAAFYGGESVRALETTDPQAVAREGLAALGRLSVDSYGQGFLVLSVPKQMELVGSIGTSNRGGPLRGFFEIMRREAIRGYYTTAEGLRELDYKGNMYYPYCPGCEAASDVALLNSRHQR
jgi:gluconate 2-dehydrogenase subunit 3-like protein